MPIATRKRSKAVIAIAIAVLAPAAMAQEAPALFRSVQMEAPPESGEYEAAYHVELDHEAIRQPAQRLWLNLPDREPEWVELDFWSPRAGYIQKFNPDDPDNPITIPDPSAAPEDFSWRWEGTGGNYTVALTMHKGRVAGRISGPGRDRYALDLRTLDSTRLGRVTPGYWRLHPDREARAAAPAAMPMPGAPAVPEPILAGGGWAGSCTGEPPPGIHVIDVLVLYTQGTLDRYFTHEGVVMKMTEVLDDANRSLRKSGIQNVTFSMRGPEFISDADAGSAYDVTLIEDVLPHLSGIQQLAVPPYMTFPGNAYVAGRRDAMWADIVALARNDLTGASMCGYSWIQNQQRPGGSHYVWEPGQDWGEKFAYMVFDPACNADALNFAHELGHQLGLEHDPRNSGTTVTTVIAPSCSWAYGHRRSNVPERFRFRTVMSYLRWGPHGGSNQTCGVGEGDPELCPLIDAFSNPDLEWAGFASGGGPPPYGIQPLGTVSGAIPIGVATWSSQQRQANASDVIRRVAPISAAFRARPEAIFSHGFE